MCNAFNHSAGCNCGWGPAMILERLVSLYTPVIKQAYKALFPEIGARELMNRVDKYIKTYSTMYESATAEEKKCADDIKKIENGKEYEALKEKESIEKVKKTDNLRNNIKNLQEALAKVIENEKTASEEDKKDAAEERKASEKALKNAQDEYAKYYEENKGTVDLSDKKRNEMAKTTNKHYVRVGKCSGFIEDYLLKPAGYDFKLKDKSVKTLAEYAQKNQMDLKQTERLKNNFDKEYGSTILPGSIIFIKGEGSGNWHVLYVNKVSSDGVIESIQARGSGSGIVKKNFSKQQIKFLKDQYIMKNKKKESRFFVWNVAIHGN